jgi:hypothetical protein
MSKLSVLERDELLPGYLRSLVRRHDADPDYGVESACWFQAEESGLVNLLEISGNVLDPGDASFYGVTLAAPESEAGVVHVRFILVSPDEFDRALREPDSPGGHLISRLRRSQQFEVLSGAGTRYDTALRCGVN